MASMNSRVTTHDSRSVRPQERARSCLSVMIYLKVYLSHDLIFVNGVNASLFDGLSEGDQFLVSVKFSSMFETSSPGKDTTIRK